MYDVLIKNVNIIDGSGKAPYISDLAIKDGKIATIGEITDPADTVIEGAGLTLTPGFIDSHGHADKNIMTYPEQKEKLEQGITFTVGGQCGGSVVPTSDTTVSQFMENIIPQGCHQAVFVGHGSLRKAVMGNKNQKPTAEEMDKMISLLRDAMEHGAVGMSLGLIYMPGCYADTDEVLTLARVVKEYDGLLSSHIRNEGDTLIEAVEEFLYIIKNSGCRAVFSHHKSAGIKNHGKVKTSLAMIDKAIEEGCDIYLDVYPYIASHTSLSASFFPKRFHPIGAVDVCKCLSDNEIRERVRAEKPVTVPVLLTFCGVTKELEGRYLADIAKERGCDLYDTAFDLIIENDNKVNACYFSMCEEDVKTVIAHPRAMICTDSAVARDNKKYHPRLRAAFPRVLCRYRDKAGLAETVRKITSLPAQVYKLSGKGEIREGYDADICIFDADKICDNADYVNCSLANSGLEYVIVNGRIVVKDNIFTGGCYAKIWGAK